MFHKKYRWLATAVVFWITSLAVSASAARTEHTLTIRDLVQLTVLSHRSIAIAPGGEVVAYVAVSPEIDSDSYRAELRVATIGKGVHTYHVVTSQSRAVRTPTTDGDELPGSFVKTGIETAWSDNGNTLFYSIVTNGKSEVHAWDRDTKAEHILFTVDKTIDSIKFQGPPSAIKYCTMETVAEKTITSDPAFHYDQETFDISRVNLWSKVEHRSARRECIDRILATGNQESLGDSIDRKVDPIRGTFNGLQPKTYMGWPVESCFPSPSRLALWCTAEKPRSEVMGDPGEDVLFVAMGKDFTELHQVLRLHGKEWRSITPMWTTDGRILMIKRGPTSSDINEYNLRDHSVRTITTSTWGIYNAHLSADNRYLFATREMPNVPPEFCRIDLQTGDILLLDQLNSGFANIRMPDYKPVSIPNQYGDIVNGYLFLPMTTDTKPHPFVAIRGIEEDGFALGTGEECPGLVLAAEGYYVFFFDISSLPYHQSAKGNTAYTLLRWKSPIASIGKLIDDLAAESKVDKARTGIAGLSAGADLVDYASAFTTVFHAGEATTGEAPAPANYLLYGNFGAKFFFSEAMSLPFPDATGIGKWSEVSATLNASRTTMPMLFQPPDSEALVGLWQPAAIMRMGGAPADLYVCPDEGHIKVHPLNRYYVMTRDIQWFDFWLRDIEDPRSEFAGQFKGWEKMRDAWQARKAKQALLGGSSKRDMNSLNP